MAVPTAPQEGGSGSKVHFLSYDGGGSNAAAIWRAYRTATLNGTVHGAAAVYPVSGTLEHGSNLLSGSTAEQLTSTSFPCQGVVIKAYEANANDIYVGLSDVTADTNASTSGFPLAPGEKQSFPCANPNTLYIRGTSGDGVAWICNLD
jgi:hypothetical protein